MAYNKQEYLQCFQANLDTLLSIYCEETAQEDYTNLSNWREDISGVKYGQWRKRNHKFISALEKLKQTYRHALSRWD